MGKTYRFDDRYDPRKDTQKAKADKKQQGQKDKQLNRKFWMQS